MGHKNSSTLHLIFINLSHSAWTHVFENAAVAAATMIKFKTKKKKKS